jgi:hypothetical protein
LEDNDVLGPVNVSEPVNTIGPCVPDEFSPARNICPTENVIFSVIVLPDNNTIILGFESVTEAAARVYAAANVLNGYARDPDSLYVSLLKKSTYIAVVICVSKRGPAGPMGPMGPTHPPPPRRALALLISVKSEDVIFLVIDDKLI